MSRFSGVGVSPGRASGPVVWLAEPVPEPERSPTPDDLEVEAARIQPAADLVASRLFARASSTEGDARAILETTAAMAMDPALLSEAEGKVRGAQLPAPRAVYEAALVFAESLRQAGGYLAERVADVEDVRDRIIAELQGIPAPGIPDLTEPSVLIGRDLAPADAADLDPGQVLALVTEEGGPTSHAAILARSLEIPAVVATRGILERSHTAYGGSAVLGAVVDGASATVELFDQPVETVAARKVYVEWNGTGATADGLPVRLLANVGSVTDSQTAIEMGAAGVGLFRTEFCYLAAQHEPDLATQRAAYTEVLAPFEGKPVIVRTLDAGADKPLDFLQLGDEPNPALGVRGLRVAFERPELLERQFQAILAAGQDSGAQVSIMAPMVSTVEDASWFVERARSAGVERVGVMLEVPSLALLAEELVEIVDFVSIGTNDLSQYVFAADRTRAALASLTDPWQPGLLRLVARVGEAGQASGTPIGVCGEAAADPLLAKVLVGLGVRSLSMMPSALPQVGASLATSALVSCQKAAQAALAAVAPGQARAAAEAALESS